MISAAMRTSSRPVCSTRTMLDSYDIVTLVTNMEITFNFRIDGTDVVPENFGSVDSIVALLEKYGVH